MKALPYYEKLYLKLKGFLEDITIPLTLKNAIKVAITKLEEYKTPTTTYRAYFIPLVLDPRIKLNSLSKIGYSNIRILGIEEVILEELS